jgi:putative flippase GtrA
MGEGLHLSPTAHSPASASTARSRSSGNTTSATSNRGSDDSVWRLLLNASYESLRRSAIAGRITRYTIGSVVAAAVSAAVFALAFALGVGTTADSVIAFVAGAIPNWFLNRRWTWQRRGRPVFGREVIGYALMSIVCLFAASAATAWTKDQAQSIADPEIRVLLVTASYLAVVAVMFVAKFAVYELWVFSGRATVRATLRSRRQVVSAARANRKP